MRPSSSVRKLAIAGAAAASLLLLLGNVGVTSPATASAASGGTVYVNGNDSTPDTGGCGTKQNPCQLIQDGIANATAGQTVRVEAGTYAGAIVDRAVHLEAHGTVIIDRGPYSHPGAFQAGFLFNADRSGSGASIQGFHFAGAAQFSGPDDGRLDFAIFSRGADNVTIDDNEIDDTLQGITDWNGAGWTITRNTLDGLWTRCGGGIGILVGGFDGVTAITGNEVSHNTVGGTVQVDPADCGGYDADGIVLFADFRFGRAGAPSVTGNTVSHNDMELVSDTPTVVDVRGIELTVGVDAPPVPVVMTGNTVDHNDIDGVTGNGIAVSTGTEGNQLAHNKVSGATAFSCTDATSGSGTAGTANTWDHDAGNIPSSPAGICEVNGQG